MRKKKTWNDFLVSTFIMMNVQENLPYEVSMNVEKLVLSCEKNL